jgi:murein DD-endopeptidase MepM/ murein hydrolase activator NlpD
VTLRRERGGYGLYILITRDPQLSTLYGHLDWPLVQAGDVVAAGQAIALMGSTGNSTGPHLHFEVRIAGVPVDPLPLLENPKGGGG